MNTTYMNGYNSHKTGPTCADDSGGLHVLQQAGNGGVITGVQGIAVDAKVELQPAGLRVKGHLVFQHCHVEGCCSLTVQLHMPKGKRLGERERESVGVGLGLCIALPLLYNIILYA